LGNFDGMAERNENEDKLIEFASRNDLKIANTFFLKKHKLKWTWISPDSKTKNEIDHFLINDNRVINNIVCMPSFKFPSDHRLVRATLKVGSVSKL